MNTSPNGVAFIESQEGYAAVPYPDEGKLAWGFGHDQQPGEIPPASLTRAEAEALLIADLRTRFEPSLNRLLPATATQNQYDACADFCYNDGPVHLAVMLSHGWSEVPVQMVRWVFALKNGVETIDPGLVARRKAEVALFLS